MSHFRCPRNRRIRARISASLRVLASKHDVDWSVTDPANSFWPGSNHLEGMSAGGVAVDATKRAAPAKGRRPDNETRFRDRCEYSARLSHTFRNSLP
jgi:hypothetical protein